MNQQAYVSGKQTNDNPPLVLASSSPYRKELLARLQLGFLTSNPQVDETPLAAENPEALALRLSESKARAVAGQFQAALVIGSDQVASANGKIYGKPGSHSAAVKQLGELAGKTATFYTGLCLYDGRDGQVRLRCVPTEVRFRNLDAALIENYLLREPAYDCAGAARSEGLGVVLIDSISSDDPSALVGLPLIALVSLLGEAGVSVLPG